MSKAQKTIPAAETEAAFRAEFAALLAKYGAELRVDARSVGYYAEIIVEIDGIYEPEYTREYAEFELKSH